MGYKLKLALLAVAVFGISGCYSYVKTYDGKGALIAECNYGAVWAGFIPVVGFSWTPIPPCTGSANPADQTANAVINPWTPPPPMSSACPEGKELRGRECYPASSAVNDLLKARVNGR
jgi:hypothetical protein